MESMTNERMEAVQRMMDKIVITETHRKETAELCIQRERLRLSNDTALNLQSAKLEADRREMEAKTDRERQEFALKMDAEPVFPLGLPRM